MVKLGRMKIVINLSLTLKPKCSNARGVDYTTALTA